MRAVKESDADICKKIRQRLINFTLFIREIANLIKFCQGTVFAYIVYVSEN
jgi:hypothetical protein